MNNMTIASAKYVNFMGQPSSITATIDGQELFVPMTPGNRHYEAIMAAVEAGTLVIQEAE